MSFIGRLEDMRKGKVRNNEALSHTYKNGKHGWMLDKATLGARNLKP